MGGRTHTGFVLNLSASGIFVQTNAVVPSGTEAKLTLRPSKDESISLVAITVRARRGHRSVNAIQSKGIAFEIKNAPEAFYTVLAEMQLS